MSFLPKETLSFVEQYGGRCRDCADYHGICPNSGLPCAEARKVIQWVIDAINYGVGRGYLTPSTASKGEGAGRET